MNTSEAGGRSTPNTSPGVAVRRTAIFLGIKTHLAATCPPPVVQRTPTRDTHFVSQRSRASKPPSAVGLM